MTTTTETRRPKSWLLLAVFIIVVVGVGGLIGTQSVPGAWYENLQKPLFNPPNWIFGPVWFTLYILIAVAGWRIWILDRNSLAMKFWFAQMALNWLWSPVWFIAQMPWPAFAIIVALLAAIVGFIVSAWQRDKPASLLFLPYLAWVAFASLLNLSIALLN